MRASVIIPAFNASATIEAAIRSVREQSQLDIEILVSDDCSTDETAEIVSHITTQDDRVRLPRTLSNSGPAVARNVALDAARGDWIFILDADDRFHCDRIATLLSLGETAGADLVADNPVLCYEDGSLPDSEMLSPDTVAEPRVVSFTEFMEHSLGRRGVARGVSWVGLKPAWRHAFMRCHELRYDERVRWGEDYLIYVASFMQGAKSWLTPRAMYYHAVRRDSLTDHPRPADLWLLAETDRAMLCAQSVASQPALRHAIERHCEAHVRWFHYQAFVNALNDRRPLQAARVMVSGTDAAYQITRALAANLVLDSLAYLRRFKANGISTRGLP